MRQKNNEFPLMLFIIYFLFYAGQAVYSTYLNLFLSNEGLSYFGISFITSFSTIFVLVAQYIGGVAGDSVKSRKNLLGFLFFAGSVTALIPYLGNGFVFYLIAICIFTVFYSPMSPLIDDYSLGLLRKNSDRFEFNSIRVGGTIGYASALLFSGLLIKNDYSNTFILVSLPLAASFILICFLDGRCPQEREKSLNMSFKHILKFCKDKPLMLLVIFNLIYLIGTNSFYSFYPLLLQERGFSVGTIGILMFICTASEIPILFCINTILKKIGLRKLLIYAGIITSVRWVLLYITDSVVLIGIANILHGIGFTSFSYGIVTFIATHVSSKESASGQSFNSLTTTVGSKIVFTYLAGVMGESFGLELIFLFNAGLMVISTILFAIISSRRILI